MKIDFEHDGRPVTLFCKDGDHISRTIKRKRDFYEAKMLRHIGANKPEGTIIDVGANIGNHTVFFGLFTGARKIVAVEPSPEAASYLRDNIAANGLADKVDLLEMAAGTSAKTVGLKQKGFRNIGFTRVGPGNDIAMDRLDERVTEADVSLIKIDVEGYEEDVLWGAMRILVEQRPDLYVEATTMRRRAGVEDAISHLGYERVGVFNRAPTWHYAVPTKPIFMGEVFVQQLS
jgi:FkbM family methyltransferase